MATKLTKILTRIANRDSSLDRKSRRGPQPMDAAEKRAHCVSVRLNKQELALLDAARGRMMRGEFMRLASLDELPPVIPEINREAWAVLAKVAGNLATIGVAMRSGEYIDIAGIKHEVDSLRKALIGLK